MATYKLLMPQLGETVEEGTLSGWHKQPGDKVLERELVADIETDKVATEVESPVPGTLSNILVQSGETVPVGAVLAEIETTDAYVQETKVEKEKPASSTSSEPEPASSGTLSGVDLQLSPRVRRMVEEHGIDLDELAAFVDRPRVDRGRIDAFLEQRGTSGPDAGTPDGQAGRMLPWTRIRKLTGQRMVESKAASPHVASAIEVDFEAIGDVRAAYRAQSGPEDGLTWLPFVACAAARTLMDFERLNAVVREEGLLVQDAVHLGITVDMEGRGLVVPVVRNAHEATVSDMAERIVSAASAARAGELAPDDLAGGTFTVTSQGASGTLFTTAIIQQPQVAILSMDGIRRRPLVVDDEESGPIVTARYCGILTLSWDHRAIDGTYAAAFLAALRDRLERETDWRNELKI